MSKITTILDAFVTRCAAIVGVNTPVKRPRTFNPDETPGIAIYRGPTELIDNQDEGPALLDMPVTVDYYRAQAGAEDASDRAELMIDSLLGAVETSDAYLSGTLCEPVYALSDDVLIPEDAGDIIRATVVFNCRFMRDYGG